MNFYLYLPFIYLLLQTCWGYKTGAPLATCQAMAPGHDKPAQTSPNPYKVVLSKTTIAQGETIDITLTSKNGRDQFKGFLIQIRQADGGNSKIPMAFGEFGNEDVKEAKQLHCFNVHNNAMTHTTPDPKTSVTVQWFANNETEVGEYKVHTTFVKEYSTFWTNQVHDEVIHVTPATSSSYQNKGQHHLQGKASNVNWDILCSSKKLDPELEPQREADNAYEYHVERKVEQGQKIWINTTSEYGTQIKKLFMQVRRPAGKLDIKAYGKFVFVENHQIHKNEVELGNCYGGIDNSVLYTKTAPGLVSDFPVQWIAPEKDDGDFEILTTILSDETTLWDQVGKTADDRKIFVQKKGSKKSSSALVLPNKLPYILVVVGLYAFL